MFVYTETYDTKFKYIILTRQISYASLSSITGISRQSLSNYANAIRKPSIDDGRKIINALGLKAEDIFELFEPFEG